VEFFIQSPTISSLPDRSSLLTFFNLTDADSSRHALSRLYHRP